MKLVHLLVGAVLTGATPARRDQRGLSQSTEIALLTAAVLGVVTIIVVAITAYVNAKLPRP